MVDWSRTADADAQLAETDSHITAHLFTLYAKAVESTWKSRMFSLHLLFNRIDILSVEQDRRLIIIIIKIYS